MFQKFVITLLIAALYRDSKGLSVAVRKSEEKCTEYAALVYENKEAPILRINAGSNKVSHCQIVETPLIVGGELARLAEFPHMAVLGYGNGSDITWQCGGSIISERYILTAAHCMASPYTGPVTKVRVGLVNLLTPGDAMQERNVAQLISHPDYTRRVNYHDIGLIELDRPLELNPQIRPACLEVNSQLSNGTAIASGFGKTHLDDDSISKELRKVRLNYISKDVCAKIYENFNSRRLPQGLIPSLFCAGVMTGGKDTCHGDSGSPLQRVLEEPYCMFSIVGVTSFGIGCAFQETPAIYTKVSSYLDWIESIVWP